jgi:hypothetical protein
MILALGLAFLAPMVRADEESDFERERYQIEQDAYWAQWQAD